MREVVLRGRSHGEPLRSQLEASTIAICQVLRSWLQAGIVEEVDPILLHKADATVPGKRWKSAEQESGSGACQCRHARKRQGGSKVVNCDGSG